jgi:hypothetical protein
MPLYPSKVLRARERAQTPYPSTIFSLGLTFESLKELGACHNIVCKILTNFDMFVAIIKIVKTLGRCFLCNHFHFMFILLGLGFSLHL